MGLESDSELSRSTSELGLWERLGATLPRPQRQRLLRLWLRARVITAGILVVSGLLLALLWSWPGGLLIAGLSAVSGLDSWYRVRTARLSDPVLPVWLDTTAIYIGLSVANVPDASVGIVFSYLIISSLVLMPLRHGLPAMVYASVWYVAIVHDWVLLGRELTDSERIVTGATSGTIFLFAFAGMLSVMIQIMNRNTLRQVRRTRMQQAIAEASNALLDDGGESALETALTALLRATDAVSVFVDKNVEHPHLGLCASLVIEVEREGAGPDSTDQWEMVPWAYMTGRETLAAGKSHMIRFSEMKASERALYSDSAIQSELDIPIFVRGEWWGVIGFSDVLEDKDWARRDQWLLFAAADMIGAYLERKEVQVELEGLIDDMDSQLRYQQALADCARALQTVDDPKALGDALTALFDATDADLAYVHANFEDSVGGLSYRVIQEVGKPKNGDAREHLGLRGHSYAVTPTILEALRSGEAAQIRASELTREERELYDWEGIKAELRLPISVGGEWRGSIGFADHWTERRWTDLELRALEVASKMIASFWERTEAHDRLGEMVNLQRTRLLYEKAIADCSKALLTSDDETAIDVALSHLMEATGTHKVFVDSNVEDPERGLVAIVKNEVTRSGFEHLVDEEIWVDDDGVTFHWELPYAQLPSLSEKLSSGLPAVVIPRLLGEAERQAYGGDPVLTELNIPIIAGGEWIGSIGFADYVEERAWHYDEISLLQTVAEMIGAFWERQAARRRLEELIRSKDAFIAAVSHELRTPLTSVVGLSAELRDRRSEFSQGEIDALVEVIAEQSTEVADIVNDLLVAARADIGTLGVALRTVDVGLAIDSITRTRFLDDFAEVSVENVNVEVLADPVRLNQILRNLVVNASRYGGDSLRIHTTGTGRHTSIRVADNGAGVDKELIEHIFEPYGRAHQVRTQPESVGLGLAVARDLARLMNGDLEYSRKDGWTEFTLRLPSAEVALAANA